MMSFSRIHNECTNAYEKYVLTVDSLDNILTYIKSRLVKSLGRLTQYLILFCTTKAYELNSSCARYETMTS